MKKYIYFILLSFATLACKAQNPVYDISESREGTPGSYYKDLNGVLNGYDGTYLYTDGNTSLKIILKKKIKSYRYYFEDLIVGEYQYIKNGIELNNTLANIDINYTDESVNHIITGHRIIMGSELGCPDCSPTEKRLRLSFIDDDSCCLVGLDILKNTINGTEAIKVSIFTKGAAVILKQGDPIPPDPRILSPGDYVMIKQ